MTLQKREAQETENKSYIVEGYATTFERYVLWPGETEADNIYESFNAECFRNCDMSDVIFQLNHEGTVFARQSNGTLQLDIDEHGLHVVADLSKTTKSREMFEEIEAGLVTKMSWGFMPQEYEYDKKSRTIVHKSVKKIYDVSAVSIPANDQTEIQARSFADGVVDKAMKEIQERENKKKLLELKLKLMEV